MEPSWLMLPSKTEPGGPPGNAFVGTWPGMLPAVPSVSGTTPAWAINVAAWISPLPVSLTLPVA